MLIVASPSAWAQEPERTPSPEELWKAYPLDPGDAQLPPEPDAEIESSPTRAAAAEEDGGGMPLIVPIMLIAPLVFIAGLALRQRRRRDRAAEVPVAATPEPKRFDWRTYPPPARPAPPPPAAPAQVATAVAVRSPWTRQDWRAEVVWDAGFKVMVLEPGRSAPVSNGDGPGEDPEHLELLQDLQAALEVEGWTPAGRAEPWYGRRFVWQHPDPPPGQGGPR